MSSLHRLCIALFVLAAASASAASCPADTVYVGEDDSYLYCKRLGDYVGADQATRAAILRNGMQKLRYPYHMVEGRCLNGDVALCPTNEEEHEGGCYDCSALVYDVLRSIGLSAPPSADNQFRYFSSIPNGIKRSEPMLGDVVFFKSTDSDRIVHTGFFVGMHDGRVYYLNASSRRGKVWVSRMPAGKAPFAYGNVSMLRVGKD